MSRSTEEWIGKTDDTPIPPRVKLRVFTAAKGICWISGRKITPADQWDCDHKIALINGGENRESNLAPALRDKHREKTALDVKAKSKTARIQMRQAGIERKKVKIQSPGFRRAASNTRDINSDLENEEGHHNA